jgi:energy-coupling factor transporter ATP-binding protein EcfA2
MSNVYKLIDVFTPMTPASVTFVDRVKEDVNNRLVRALDLLGNQIVIYGHSGSGKSTLLENVLFRTYEKQINTYCMIGMTFEEVILDAFDQLDEFYVREVTNNKKTKVDVKAKANYLLIKAQIGAVYENAVGERQVRMLPPQLTPQSLGRLLGQSGYCWVLEDFHKIQGEDKNKLAQMMKVFVNLSIEYKDLKIVALGAVNTARLVVKSDREMRKRITEIHVELMEPDEIKEIIKKGCEALNISMDVNVKNEIVKYSNELAAICHKICYLLCKAGLLDDTAKEKVNFSYEDLQIALSEYVKDEEDSIRDAFDSAMKLPKVESTLRILASQGLDGAHLDDLFQWSKNNHVKITKKKLSDDLDKLEQEEFGELIKVEEKSQIYSFLDPFYLSFCMAYLQEKDSKLKRNKISDKEKLDLFNRAFRVIRSDFSTEELGAIGHNEL